VAVPAHCHRELSSAADNQGGRSRLLFEGEAEGKTPQLSSRALAKWADPAQRYLICPKCGIRELAELS
ncbi:MAG: hypothetical protein QUS14_04860, partial [Pyrinomonadaceae bacterium]|nr:hypothetical protein [Pyrinomonadaceae bacterium]